MPLAKPKNPKTEKLDKSKKIKVIRDSFTIPKVEFEHIDALKKRLLTLGVAVKKSELLRAGLLALVAQKDAALLAAVRLVPVLKTGRPEAARSVASPTPRNQSTTARKTPRKPANQTAVKAVTKTVSRAPTSVSPVKASRPVVSRVARPTTTRQTPVKTSSTKAKPKGTH